MRNTINNGNSDARTAVRMIRDRLPPGWSVELSPKPGIEPALSILASNGSDVVFQLLVRKQIAPRDIPGLVRQASTTSSHVLVVAQFLSPRSRQLLIEENANYVDATGNLRIVVSKPAIFLEGLGADHDPDRQPRPLHSLKGAAAGRVVRALCDFVPPYGVRELAERCATPIATVSRVVGLMERDALISRNDRKQIVAVDWASTLTRWVQDYSIAGSNLVKSFLEPRGLGALGAKLERLDRYAVTGSLAGPGIAPTRLAMLYVDDADAAGKALELVPTDAGANVWLIEPFDDVVFDRTVPQRLDFFASPREVVTTAPSQVAADLLTSPGRGPQEGEALIEKLKENENAWRHRP